MMNIELIAAQYRLEIRRTYKNHVICKDSHDYAIIEPNGNVHFGLHSIAVCKAWINS